MSTSPHDAVAPSPRALPPIIDVHSHILLDLGDGTDAETGVPLDKLPSWSVERALALMDENGIAAALLSIPDAANRFEGARAREVARMINERLAEIVAGHPTRFGALAAVPGRDPDAALDEMAYALDTLGMDGVATSTSIGGTYLGDARFDPWFAEMDRRRITLFAHPVLADASHAVDLGLHPSLLEFMFDTTRMIANMVFGGAKARFPGISLIATHAGGTLPYLVERLQTLEMLFGAGAGRPTLGAEEVKAGFASFHYDLTAGTSSAQLHALAQLVPTSRLLMGFDNPFMPPASFATARREVEAWAAYGEDDLRAVASGTAARLFPCLAGRVGAGIAPG